MTDNKLRYKNIAIAAARLADAKKAEAVSVYDMAGRSELADYVVVITVDNPAQLDAVDDEITINFKKEGLFALYRDGMNSKTWKVLDYGGIIVHVFEKQAREFFSFDKVYAGYNTVKWEEKPAAKEVADHRPQAASRREESAVEKAASEKAKAVAKKVKAAPAKVHAAPKKIKAAAKKAPAEKSKKPAAKKVPAKKASAKKAAVRKAAPKKAKVPPKKVKKPAAKKTAPGKKKKK